MAEVPEKIWLTPQFAEVSTAMGGGIYHVNLSSEEAKDCAEYVRLDLHEQAVREARRELASKLVEGVTRVQDSVHAYDYGRQAGVGLALNAIHAVLKQQDVEAAKEEE